MSLGFYKLIKGRLVVREKQSPDGDSMRFIANDMSLFEDLPRFSPPSSSHGEESYQLRFQAIDAPELHYGGAAQPHGLESRNCLLEWLQADASEWDWDVAPNGFKWEIEAEILCDAFEGHGRPIAFVLPSSDRQDGADIKLTMALLSDTYNYHAVETGNVYLGLYSGSLSVKIKTRLIDIYKQARSNHLGIWQLDQTSRFKVATLNDLRPEQGNLIYPKIFRRCVDALRWAGGEFEPGRDIDDFLMESPDEDDQFVINASHGGHLKSNLSAVLEQVNNKIKIEIDLNTVEFVSK